MKQIQKQSNKKPLWHHLGLQFDLLGFFLLFICCNVDVRQWIKIWKCWFFLIMPWWPLISDPTYIIKKKKAEGRQFWLLLSALFFVTLLQWNRTPCNINSAFLPASKVLCIHCCTSGCMLNAGKHTRSGSWTKYRFHCELFEQKTLSLCVHQLNSRTMIGFCLKPIMVFLHY